MKTLINKTNPALRITAPEIRTGTDGYYYMGCVGYHKDKWTLVEEEPKHTEVWLEGRTIFEQEGEPTEGIKVNLAEIPSNVDLEKAAIDYGMRCYKRGFVDGKEWQKKQDELTWEDIKRIIQIADSMLTGTAWDAVDYPDEQKYYEEVLKQYKEEKK